VIHRLFLLFLAFWLSASVPGQAEALRELKWEDLVPKRITVENPLQHLNEGQKAKLSFVLRIRALKERLGLPDDSDMVRKAEEQAGELEQEGVSIDRLIARNRALRETRRRRDESVVRELDGRLVRLAGYVVPLEYAGTRVTEFLLVPFAGACVHVPPPPPNQIVHVRLDNGFENAGLYTPVRVTGRLSAKGISRSLFLTDGTLDISVAYSLQGNGVQPYGE
jgi:hypothetical protein